MLIFEFCVVTHEDSKIMASSLCSCGDAKRPRMLSVYSHITAPSDDQKPNHFSDKCLDQKAEFVWGSIEANQHQHSEDQSKVIHNIQSWDASKLPSMRVNFLLAKDLGSFHREELHQVARAVLSELAARDRDLFGPEA